MSLHLSNSAENPENCDRGYQSEATARIISDISSGVQAGTLIIGTGGGKTRIVTRAFQEIVEQKGPNAKMLYVGPSVAAAARIQEEVAKLGLPFEVSKWNKSLRDFPEVTFTTVQALLNRLGQHNVSPTTFDFVAVDEGHWFSDNMFYQAVQSFQSPTVYMTATPQGSTVDLLKTVPHNFFTHTSRDLIISDGFPEWSLYRYPVSESKIVDAKILAGEYSLKEGEEFEVLDMPHRFAVCLNILNQTIRNDERTICFMPSVASVIEMHKIVCATYPELSDKIAFVHGGLPKEKLREIHRKFETGQIVAVLANEMWSESLDVKPIEHVILCDPVRSERQILQRIGRGARRYEGKTTLKIHDVVSVIENLNYRSISKTPKTVAGLLGLDTHFDGQIVLGKDNPVDDNSKKPKHQQQAETEVVYLNNTTVHEPTKIPIYEKLITGDLSFLRKREEVELVIIQIAKALEISPEQLYLNQEVFSELPIKIRINFKGEKEYILSLKDLFDAIKIYCSAENQKSLFLGNSKGELPENFKINSSIQEIDINVLTNKKVPSNRSISSNSDSIGKAKWRKDLLDFAKGIKKQLFPVEHFQTRGPRYILCFPGNGSEANLWLRFGANEEELVFVERDKEIAASLQKKYPKATIVCCDFEDERFLDNLDLALLDSKLVTDYRFGVISIDPENSLSKKLYLNLLQLCTGYERLHSSFILSINLTSARNKPALREICEEMGFKQPGQIDIDDSSLEHILEDFAQSLQSYNIQTSSTSEVGSYIGDSSSTTMHYFMTSLAILDSRNEHRHTFINEYDHSRFKSIVTRESSNILSLIPPESLNYATQLLNNRNFYKNYLHDFISKFRKYELILEGEHGIAKLYIALAFEFMLFKFYGNATPILDYFRLYSQNQGPNYLYHEADRIIRNLKSTIIAEFYEVNTSETAFNLELSQNSPDCLIIVSKKRLFNRCVDFDHEISLAKQFGFKLQNITVVIDASPYDIDIAAMYREYPLLNFILIENRLSDIVNSLDFQKKSYGLILEAISDQDNHISIDKNPQILRKIAERLGQFGIIQLDLKANPINRKDAHDSIFLPNDLYRNSISKWFEEDTRTLQPQSDRFSPAKIVTRNIVAGLAGPGTIKVYKRTD